MRRIFPFRLNFGDLVTNSKELVQTARQILLRKGDVDREFLEAMREKVVLFLQRAPLEESIVIFDGPGLGCSSSMVVLALLGWERIRRLKAIHAISASGYGLLMFYGAQRGAIGVERGDFPRWNKENQKRHGIVPGIGVYRLIYNKIRLRAAFDRALLSGPVTYTLNDAFTSQGIESLPENFFFWTYNKTKQCLTPIHAKSEEFHGMKLSQIMQAVAAVPHLYDPLHWRHGSYQDGFYAPNLRKHYQALRKSSTNALFCHMNYDGFKDGTLFLKMHRNGSGYVRVSIDFLYFILGIDNPEFVELLRYGLFDVEPIESGTI